MKPFAIVAAVVVAGAALLWMLNGRDERGEQAQAPPPVEAAEEVAMEPAAMALPPELEDFEVEEVVSEEEVEDIKPLHVGELKKPKVISRKGLPDGRIEVRILSPIYYGNGKTKNLIRVLRASPRKMKSDTIQIRQPRKNNPAPGTPAAGGGNLKKKE